MGKFRIRAWLDQAIFVVLIMAGATMTAVFDVRAIAGAIASGKHGLGSVVAATAPLPPVAAASGARSSVAGTIVAELAR